MLHTAEDLDRLMEAMKDPRNVIRFKVRALLDIFNPNAMERTILFSRLEKGLREASDVQLNKALEILRE